MAILYCKGWYSTCRTLTDQVGTRGFRRLAWRCTVPSSPAPPAHRRAKQVSVHAAKAERCRLADQWFRPDSSMSVTSNPGLYSFLRSSWLNGERSSTVFVEAKINLLVSRRFAKKQQMRWGKPGAHLLPQTAPGPSAGCCVTCSPNGIQPWPPTTTSLHCRPLRPDQLPCFDMLPSAPGLTQ